MAVLTIRHEPDSEGCVVCSPAGELEAFTVASFRQALADLAGSERLVIDMSAVTFVDSAGLGALIGGIRRVRDLGGDVAVACSRPTIRRLLDSTGFTRIVTVAESVSEAVAALPGPAAGAKRRQAKSA